MYYKLRKPQRTKLPKLFQRYMEALGATPKPIPTTPNSMEYSLVTALGILNLTYHTNDDGRFPTLFTRFDSPQLAKTVVDCNPYSGKYNCHTHVFKGMTAIDVISRWETHLRPVLWHIKAPYSLGLASSNFVLSLYPIDQLNKIAHIETPN